MRDVNFYCIFLMEARNINEDTHRKKDASVEGAFPN